MKCQDLKCGKGEVDLKQGVSLQTGCRAIALAYPCLVCGRLHWQDGTLVISRREEEVYLQNGQLVHIPKAGRSLAV